MVGYERELLPNTLLQTQYIHRNFDDFMAVTETRLEWQPVELPDPGPDGVLGNADDGPAFTAFQVVNPGDQFLWLTNPTDAYRRYDALQAVVRKRWADRWQMQVSYTWSRTTGTASNGDYVNAGLNEAGDLTGGINSGKFLNPNGRINNDGRAQYDVSEFKALGAYEPTLWGGFVLSGILQHRSGNRWQRQITYFGTLIPNDAQTILLEPRGTRRTPGVWNLDMRVEKTFYRAGPGRKVGIAFDVFNVTNQGVPCSFTLASVPFSSFPLRAATPGCSVWSCTPRSSPVGRLAAGGRASYNWWSVSP